MRYIHIMNVDELDLNLLRVFDIRQCWHERMHDDAGHRWLRRRIAELFAAGSANESGSR